MIRFASAPGGRRTARNGADGRREWHQDHRAPPRRSLMGEGCRQAERERGVDRGTKAGRGARMTQLRGRTPGPRARAPSDGRKSPGAPPRRRLRPAGHGAAAPRHRGAGRYQHAGTHRAGYRDAVSVPWRRGRRHLSVTISILSVTSDFRGKLGSGSIAAGRPASAARAHRYWFTGGKGKSPAGGFFMGLLLGPLGLALAVVSKEAPADVGRPRRIWMGRLQIEPHTLRSRQWKANRSFF